MTRIMGILLIKNELQAKLFMKPMADSDQDKYLKYGAGSAETGNVLSPVFSRTGNKILYWLSAIVLLTAVIVSATGVLRHSGNGPFDFTNQYGDVVRIYGKGIYCADSFFRAPIFRGTDLTMLALACPLLLYALVRDIRKANLKSRLLLVSVLGSFLYYATSIAFGVRYNELHLLYILLFAASLYALIAAMRSINMQAMKTALHTPLPRRGINIYLTITGIALFVAWLPDIITALLTNRPLLLIENYTTEITYVLDMGLIAPACFACMYLLRRRDGLGYVLLDILLTLCIIIGVMLPVQTFFQMQAGIELPVPVLITKVGSFCALALFALYFKNSLLRRVDVQRYELASRL